LLHYQSWTAPVCTVDVAWSFFETTSGAKQAKALMETWTAFIMPSDNTWCELRSGRHQLHSNRILAGK